MKISISALIYFLLIGTVNAESFNVGGKILEIPSPVGFTQVTPEMDAVYRFSLQMADNMNDQLACYIPESVVPAAMFGEYPPFERYYLLKVSKKLKAYMVGSKDFAEFKKATKQQNKQILKSLEAEIPSLLDSASEGISEEFDVDFALKISKVVPLDSHYETDNSLAYSLYINYGVSSEGSKEDYIVSGTATFLNVAGKLIFLYCYSAQEDLEWTRSASKEWARMILENNAPPPSHSSGIGGIDWGKAVRKGIFGAIGGGLLALVFGIFSIFRKKS